MEPERLTERIKGLPRAQIGFYPTPFHRLNNLSKSHNVNVFLKREDLAGPGSISGSKTRLSEFILGSAVQGGYTHVITQGVHLTNSGLQFAAASKVVGLTPILFLTRNTARHGELEEYRGNLLLNRILDVETHYINSGTGGYWDNPEEGDAVVRAMEDRKSELEKQGYKAIIVPTGGAHPLGFVAHLTTFLEMTEQARSKGVELDYIYHTAGTGTALPGLIAGKLLTGHPVKFRSVSICAYAEGGWMSISVIVNRVKEIFERLGVDPPTDEIVRAEIDIDQRFIGEDYAVPSEESIKAIRELAQADGVFVGPVYTGKGFAGLLDHIRSGRVEPGRNVAFLHTGDAANLFETPTVVGAITDTIEKEK